MSLTSVDASFLSVGFGTDQPEEYSTGLPVLDGPSVENLFQGARPAGTSGDFSVFEAGDWRLGAATVEVTRGLEAVTHRLYLALFEACRGFRLARLWNYVPAINERGSDGQENYHLFCRGRSLAFELEFGAHYKTAMPAASAVGSKTSRLTVVFAATQISPRHVENPWQVPAYEYPSTYGPRAPSFARATIVPSPDFPTVFISGTASIRGHATIAPRCTEEQLKHTLENLREISRACGLGPDLGANAPASRYFKVYLRHSSLLTGVATELTQSLFRPTDSVVYLQADICRAELYVEIEATLIPSHLHQKSWRKPTP